MVCSILHSYSHILARVKDPCHWWSKALPQAKPASQYRFSCCPMVAIWKPFEILCLLMAPRLPWGLVPCWFPMPSDGVSDHSLTCGFSLSRACPGELSTFWIFHIESLVSLNVFASLVRSQKWSVSPRSLVRASIFYRTLPGEDCRWHCTPPSVTGYGHTGASSRSDFASLVCDL